MSNRHRWQDYLCTPLKNSMFSPKNSFHKSHKRTGSGLGSCFAKGRIHRQQYNKFRLKNQKESINDCNLLVENASSIIQSDKSILTSKISVVKSIPPYENSRQSMQIECKTNLLGLNPNAFRNCGIVLPKAFKNRNLLQSFHDYSCNQKKMYHSLEVGSMRSSSEDVNCKGNQSFRNDSPLEINTVNDARKFQNLKADLELKRFSFKFKKNEKFVTKFPERWGVRDAYCVSDHMDFHFPQEDKI